MYLREVVPDRKKRPDVAYLQLVEGNRDPETGKVKTRIVHSFGRTDQLDYDRVERLARRLDSYLPRSGRPRRTGTSR